MKFKCPECGKIVYPKEIRNGKAYCQCIYCFEEFKIDLNEREKE